MLYGTNTSTASGDAHDRDYDPQGLGAISPLRRPAVITSGGGYSPQGTGGGGGAGAGETPVQGSRARSGYAPADRTTTIRFFAAQGKARGSFVKSGRGSKVSPLSPEPALEGLAGILTAFGGGAGTAAPVGFRGDPYNTNRFSMAIIDARPVRPAPVLTAPASLAPTLLAPKLAVPLARLPYGLPTAEERDNAKQNEENLSGLDDIFGWLKQRVTPPGGQLNKIQLIPKAIRNVVPTPIRTAVRYAGVIAYTPTIGMFMPASVARRTFGLSPNESKYQEIGAKVARGVAATVATAGIVHSISAGWSAGTAIKTAAIKSATAAELATPAGAYAGTAAAAGSAAQAGGTLSALAVQPSILGNPASESWLAATGKGLVSGTGKVLTAVGVNVGSQALLSTLTPKGGGEQASAPYSAPQPYGYSEPVGYGTMPTIPATGGGSGGGSSNSDDGVFSQAATPWVGVSLAAVGVYLLMSRRKSR